MLFAPINYRQIEHSIPFNQENIINRPKGAKMHFLYSFRHVTRKLNSPFTQRIVVWTILWTTARYPRFAENSVKTFYKFKSHDNTWKKIVSPKWKRSQGKFKTKCNLTWFSDSKNNKKIQVYAGFALTKSSNFCFDWHIEKYRSARNIKFRIAFADNRTEGREKRGTWLFPSASESDSEVHILS